MPSSNSGQELKDATEDSFCLDDYDCIGFDMDHTIVQYHIEELFKVCNVVRFWINLTALAMFGA